jgi:RNA polymerase sigma-70 factor, ECF subfamily
MAGRSHTCRNLAGSSWTGKIWESYQEAPKMEDSVEEGLIHGKEEAEPLEREDEIDAGSFQHLFASRIQFFRQMSFRVLANWPDAEDATQQAFLNAYRHLAQFRGRSKLSTWVSKIVINTSLMKRHTRCRALQAVPPDRISPKLEPGITSQVIDPALDPERNCIASERLGFLGQPVQSLPSGLRSSFLLCAVQGYSNKEAAQILGISLTALN